jgi:ABC-type branched-subunit amino acid transport system substrate-binding protein
MNVSKGVRRQAGRVLAIALALSALGIGSLFAPIGSAARAAPSQAKSAAHTVSTSCTGYLPTGTVVGMAATPDDGGYWIASRAGGVVACGDAIDYGSLSIVPNNPIVGIAATPGGGGYWLVATDGGVFTFGDAQFHGSTGNLHLNAPIVGMAATPDGGGYWLVASDGGIFNGGDARFFGSTGSLHLNAPIVGMAPAPGGGGYWLVASDGGIFAFNAPFFGSMGAAQLNRPVVGMAGANGDYWLVAADGGIFSFNAPFFGSTGNIVLNQPIVGMEARGRSGYRFVASDGGIFAFGSSAFFGSAVAPSAPVPNGAVCPNGAPGSGPGVTDSTITLGNVSTQSGPVPDPFHSARLGTEAFIAYQNNLGGVCGRKLSLSSADDNFVEAQNLTAVQSLAPQVLAFVGSISAVDDGGAPGIAAANVPDIGEALTPARFNLPQNFSPQPQPAGFITGPFQYFAQKFGPSVTQHMALLTEDQGTAQAQGTAQEKVMESLGYKFVYKNILSPTTSDFGSYIESMRAAGVQGIILEAPAIVYGVMASQMYAAGFTIPFANWGAPAYDPQFIANGGPGANGAILEQTLAMYEGQDAAAIPEVALFDKWYSTVSGGQVPTINAAYGWLSGMMFVQAINAGGAPTRAALFNGLREITNFDGNGMAAPANPADKVPPTCYIIIDVANGKFVRDSSTPSGFNCSGTFLHE